LDKLKTTLLTASVIAILFTSTASAQQAAKLEIVSGNGQMICPACGNNTFVNFYPLVVKVSDSSGNPIAGKTVNWQLVSNNGIPIPPTITPTSLTDNDGLAIQRLSQTPTQGSNSAFLQLVISATVDNLAAVSFTESQVLVSGGGRPLVTTALDPNEIQMTLSGAAGSTGTTPIHVYVLTTSGGGVPNVSVRILSPDPTTLPSANCSTSPGADPGSALTDANGTATCYPVFGSVPGNGPVGVLVGGLDPDHFNYISVTPDQPLADSVGYAQYIIGYNLAVTPVTPAHAFVVSGNNQHIDPGKTSSPLVVKFTDSTGNVPIGNLSVVWTVFPLGAATVSPAASTTDATGQTQTTATFSASASGQVSVTAALTGGYSGISATFTLNTNVQIASLTKVSGDQQTTQSGQPFAAPLVVQVNGTNGQPLSGQVVSFVPTGGATLSASSAQTDVTGRAQVTVTAGATPGAVTVTAFVGNFSAPAFNLTVIPPGPALTSNSFFNAGGGAKLAALSPCSLVTVTASGLAPNILGTVLNSNAFGPWATTLATDTVTVNSVAAPISSVANLNGVQQLTFQVPCEVAPAAGVPITINVGGGTGTVNMPIQAATPGIFETVMSDGTRRAVAIRPDGTFVTLLNPARPGDVVRVYVTGLGPVAPAAVTGALPYVGADSLVLGQVIVGVNNAGARVVNSRVSPNLIGVYEIDFQVPSDAPTGNDIVLSVAVNAPGDSQTRFSNGSRLPVKQ
jgi:uncharacterized protein (TIGR03437 family)